MNECDRAWRSLLTSLGPKQLRVDLRGVTYMDARGQELMAEIHTKTGADFLADTPMTKYFAKEAQRAIQKNTRRGA